jgi:hypothetical protein
MRFSSTERDVTEVSHIQHASPQKIPDEFLPVSRFLDSGGLRDNAQRRSSQRRFSSRGPAAGVLFFFPARISAGRQGSLLR